ncbi:DUF2141 domain-containing protein [Roseateles sp. LYH14W]|uniref:DUF2141 domain-containing protein n=1 Tax=Pelomonas parva TaxID=3299032 RepID=A0ABW7F326_9BURK
MKKVLLTAALIALLPLSSQAADVTLEVEGLDASRTAGAALLVGIYTEAGQWLNNAASGQRFALDAAVGGKVTVVLKNLPAGRLALSLYQDANGNGKLDMNAMGMPTEPYGFSNNASGSFGPPKFEQAVLTPVSGTAVKVRLN